MPNLRLHSTIAEIDSTQWNLLAGTRSVPLRHEFFSALEAGASVGPGTGWLPRYLSLHGDAGSLLGALPLFEKTDSCGEFIFDWNWAEALGSSGREYYPKLVVAIPYTPIPGRRLLLAAPAPGGTGTALIQGAMDYARERGVSSLHWLFHHPDESATLAPFDYLARTGCHFQWGNASYQCFDDWLATLTAARRKKIRRERRKIAAADVHCTWIEGGNFTSRILDIAYRLYAANYRAHGMRPYLTQGFFAELCRRMPEAFVACLAYRGSEILAGALFLEDSENLYGRYWGAFEWVDSLHFEVCYYQGIERAIARKQRYFHPGIQGEHKLIRGFAPVLHYSSHWLRNAELTRAVRAYLEAERQAVDRYRQAAEAILPVHQVDP